MKINPVLSMALLVSLAGIFSSCFKEDDQIVLPPLPSGEIHLMTIPQGPSYAHQVFLQLSSEDTVGNSFNGWDLAFESSPGGTHIFLNGGNFCLASFTGNFDFTSVTDTAGAVWNWDESSWNPDSSAIGDVAQHAGEVILIDRGFSFTPRFWKLMVDSLDNSHWEIRTAQVNGTNDQTLSLQKQNAKNYLYFSFDNHEVFPEPDKIKWDILFTHYRYIYNNLVPKLPYGVSGVLLNPNSTLAVLDTVGAYSEIDFTKAQSLILTSARDVIGFNWKLYNFSTSHYDIKSNHSYVIRTQAGIFYKLHFLDFYSVSGEKGFPKAEWQRL